MSELATRAKELAMEEAAKIALHRHEVHGWDDCQCHETAEAIRAAAEKEVVNEK